MKTVWVIEQGCYSDYRVVGVFTSEANARLICDTINAEEYSDKATISEWQTDPCIEELNKGLSMFCVCMNHDGTVERCDLEALTAYNMSTSLKVWKRTNALAFRGRPVSDAISGSVWAKDSTHAIKITNEFRARAIANNEMTTRE